MNRLKSIKETLIAQVQAQMGDLSCVDTHELGEVVDMIKDLEEACYYHTIIDAMHESDEYERHYYHESYYPNKKYDRDAYRQVEPHKMYYHSSERYNDYDNYREQKIPTMKRDAREGRSGMSRKGYIEARESHAGKEQKIKELEKYLNDLSTDMAEILTDLSQEEKDLLRNKMNGLVNKL